MTSILFLMFIEDGIKQHRIVIVVKSILGVVQFRIYHFRFVGYSKSNFGFLIPSLLDNSVNSNLFIGP